MHRWFCSVTECQYWGEQVSVKVRMRQGMFSTICISFTFKGKWLKNLNRGLIGKGFINTNLHLFIFVKEKIWKAGWNLVCVWGGSGYYYNNVIKMLWRSDHIVAKPFKYSVSAGIYIEFIRNLHGAVLKYMHRLQANISSKLLKERFDVNF